MADSQSSTTSLTLLADMLSSDRRDDAWKEFLTCYTPLIRGWAAAKGLQADEGEEIAARIMAKLVEKLPSYRRENGDEIRKFRPWLCTIVKNEIYDLFRGQKRRRTMAGADGSDALKDIEHREAASIEDRDIDELVRHLSDIVDDEHRRAFRLVEARRSGTKSWQAYQRLCLEGQTVARTAEELQMTPAAVSTAAHRIKRELQAEYDALTSTK